MTLALLLTAVTGAWADIAVGDVFKTGSTIDFGTSVRYKTYSGSSDNSTLGATGKQTLTYQQYTNGRHWFNISTGSGGQSIYIVSDNTAEPWGIKVSGGEGTMGNPYSFEVLFTEPPFYLTRVSQPGATPQQWEFEMPGSNVVLTPIYSAATIYDADDAEKQAYETLKEAFANVQDGDVIKLDWNVTVSEPLTTPSRGDNDPISFTLDLNGYILDAETTVEHVIKLNNGDELTISNIRDDKLGGIKGSVIATDGSHIVFDGGRYLFNLSSTAEAIQQGWSAAVQNYGWQMAEGKEFVNVNNGNLDDKGFLVRVDYAAFELTIGAGRFATFYDTHNVTMIEENQNISFYTIKRGDIDLDNNVAKVTKVENDIIPAGLPLLVYNGGEQQQTVKLKVTTTEATPIENIAYEFVGTASGREFYDEVMAEADYYALSGGKMFVPVYETGNIAPHKCWLQFNKNDQQQGARNIRLVFDNETTGVNEVNEVIEVSADTLYDLNGRKLNAAPIKGVYIKDGRKVVK